MILFSCEPLLPMLGKEPTNNARKLAIFYSSHCFTFSKILSCSLISAIIVSVSGLMGLMWKQTFRDLINVTICDNNETSVFHIKENCKLNHIQLIDTEECNPPLLGWKKIAPPFYTKGVSCKSDDSENGKSCGKHFSSVEDKVESRVDLNTSVSDVYTVVEGTAVNRDVDDTSTSDREVEGIMVSRDTGPTRASDIGVEVCHADANIILHQRGFDFM